MAGERQPGINASYKWFRLPWRCDSLSEPTHVSIHRDPFSSNKHLSCITTSHLCGNPFLQNWRAMVLSLTTGLVGRIHCSHFWGLTSISGQELTSCFQLLQAEATWDDLYPLFFCLYLKRPMTYCRTKSSLHNSLHLSHLCKILYQYICTHTHRYPYCLKGCLQGVTNFGWIYKIQWLRITVLKVECLNSNFNFPT